MNTTGIATGDAAQAAGFRILWKIKTSRRSRQNIRIHASFTWHHTTTSAADVRLRAVTTLYGMVKLHQAGLRSLIPVSRREAQK